MGRRILAAALGMCLMFPLAACQGSEPVTGEPQTLAPTPTQQATETATSATNATQETASARTPAPTASLAQGVGLVAQSQDSIFYVVNEGIRQMDRDGGNDRLIINGVALKFALAGNRLVYFQETPQEGDEWGYHSQLFCYDIQTGQSEMLFEQDHLYELYAVTEDSAYFGGYEQEADEMIYRQCMLDEQIVSVIDKTDIPEAKDGFAWTNEPIAIGGATFTLQIDVAREGDILDEVLNIAVQATRDGKTETIWTYSPPQDNAIVYSSGSVKLFVNEGTLYLQYPLNREETFGEYNILYAIQPETGEVRTVFDLLGRDNGGGYYVEFYPIGGWGFLYVNGDGEWNTRGFGEKLRLPKFDDVPKS